MTKTSLFATSLIGAIPGAFLAYLCVMAFLNHAGGASMLLKATTGLLLVVGLTMPVLSVMALLSGRGEGKPKAAKEDAKKGKKDEASADSAAEVEAGSESEAAVTGEFADTGEIMDLDDDVGDDIFADEEPAKPAGKKKKK